MAQTARVNATVRYSTDAGAHWDTLWQVDEAAGYIDIAYANRRVYALYERYFPEKRLVEEIVLKISEEIAL